jgi:LCP family protein required for cell wall assembly
MAGWAPAAVRTRRVVAVLAVLVLLLVGIVAGGLFLVSQNLGDNVVRVPDAFAGLDERARPAPATALTFLLVGTDSRSPEATTGTGARAPADVAGAQRSDVVMLAQVSPDRRSVAVVSIPRDSWVEIPGRGPDKVNAAYSAGGPALLVGTVENLTGVRVDHFAVIDFAGFRSVVDALGGVDVAVAAPTSSGGVAFHQGVNHLDGEQALVYVRQRHELAGGDLDRGRRQQNVLRALLGRLAAGDTLANPVGLYEFLDAISRSVGVDDTLSNSGLRSLAVDLRGLRPGEVRFLTAPVAGTGREGRQSVVYLDRVRAPVLWAALRAGDPAGYAAQHPDALLDDVPS